MSALAKRRVSEREIEREKRGKKKSGMFAFEIHVIDDKA
jgi:hypothetical protein